MAFSAKSFRNKLRSQGIFYSDPAVAEMLKAELPGDITEVYDPTCGDGNLLAVFGDDVVKYGQELAPDPAAAARANLKNAVIAEGDTLTAPAFADRRFRAITANPPFSVHWNPDAITADDPVFAGVPCLPPPSKADYAFILHIIHCLADDGVAAVLSFPGVLYRGQREGRLRRWIIERNLIEKVVLVEGGHFEDTDIATAIIVFRKNKPDTDITFRDNEHDIERVVKIEEVIANDYSLSVGNYVQPPAR